LGVILGHIVYSDVLLVDIKNIIAITKMPIPITMTQTKRFLGVARFYRYYFWNVASKVAPMCKLLKKDEEFKWIEACNKSWEWMKVYDMFANVNGTKLENQIPCEYRCIKFCSNDCVRSKPK
jgi:hypothetical protein